MFTIYVNGVCLNIKETDIFSFVPVKQKPYITNEIQLDQRRAFEGRDRNSLCDPFSEKGSQVEFIMIYYEEL